jgi:hypothetical protein
VLKSMLFHWPARRQISANRESVAFCRSVDEAVIAIVRADADGTLITRLDPTITSTKAAVKK